MCATSVHCKKLFARHCRTAALDRIRSSAVAWFSTSLHRVAFSLSRAGGAKPCRRYSSPPALSPAGSLSSYLALRSGFPPPVAVAMSKYTEIASASQLDDMVTSSRVVVAYCKYPP